VENIPVVIPLIGCPAAACLARVNRPARDGFGAGLAVRRGAVAPFESTGV